MVTNMSETGNTMKYGNDEHYIVGCWNTDTGSNTNAKPGMPCHFVAPAGSAWSGEVSELLTGNYCGGIFLEHPTKDIDTNIPTGSSCNVGTKGSFWAKIPTGYDIIAGKPVRAVVGGFARESDTGENHTVLDYHANRSVGIALATATGANFAPIQFNFGG